MLTLNTNEKKNLTFDVTIEGANHTSLNGRFCIVVNEVTYAITAKIQDRVVTVNIPPLAKFIKENIGKNINCYLEVFNEDCYLIPWKGKADVQKSVVVEASFRDDDSIKETRILDREETIVRTDLKPDEEIEDKKEEVSSYDVPVKTASGKQKVVISDSDKDLEEKIKDENEEEIEEPKTTLKENTIVNKKVNNKKEILKNIREEDVYVYMEKNGVKSQKIREMLYKQCSLKAKNAASPSSVLLEVAKFLKKKK